MRGKTKIVRIVAATLGILAGVFSTMCVLMAWLRVGEFYLAGVMALVCAILMYAVMDKA